MTFAKDKSASWKIIDDALFRVNDAPVKEWGVYQTGKKRDPLLLQMNNRFLLIKIHDLGNFLKLTQRRFSAKRTNSYGTLPIIPRNRWPRPIGMRTMRKPYFWLRARISAEDHLLDIELPHQLDLSGTAPHTTATRHR